MHTCGLPVLTTPAPSRLSRIQTRCSHVGSKAKHSRLKLKQSAADQLFAVAYEHDLLSPVEAARTSHGSAQPIAFGWVTNLCATTARFSGIPPAVVVAPSHRTCSVYAGWVSTRRSRSPAYTICCNTPQAQHKRHASALATQSERRVSAGIVAIVRHRGSCEHLCLHKAEPQCHTVRKGAV